MRIFTTIYPTFVDIYEQGKKFARARRPGRVKCSTGRLTNQEYSPGWRVSFLSKIIYFSVLVNDDLFRRAKGPVGTKSLVKSYHRKLYTSETIPCLV